MELKDIQSVVVWRLIFKHLMNNSPKSLSNFSITCKSIRQKINVIYNWKEIALKNLPEAVNIANILGINVDKEPEHSLKWASMYQYYRFIYPASKFGHIVHMNTQYLQSLESSKLDAILPFSHIVHLNFVWWFEVGELIKDIPVNNYKVYWLLRNDGLVKTLQSEVEIEGSSEPITQNMVVERSPMEWKYFRGPDISPDQDIYPRGSLFSLFCRLHERDCARTKGNLDIAYVLLVPSDDDHHKPPKILFKHPNHDDDKNNNDNNNNNNTDSPSLMTRLFKYFQ
ncbi:hypothetical protein DFA_08178 [Cavenderia fasciculata]|uniref:F-box domain-containing protein n=1 Tax=Cavenderia fasciculata TaxID=261658 RepID=F4Q5D2_CACFS|nr:uncharacterized protein DFA_08178 [Cavenderia fasciculata]EGG17191.1 hypothetical protein DFA_08178 [Cavenderia fasciculata]|eukprot:XP_004355675.1 hypothetical protein DFA_08178 [Cavenderia fasciculata]